MRHLHRLLALGLIGLVAAGCSTPGRQRRLRPHSRPSSRGADRRSAGDERLARADPV